MLKNKNKIDVGTTFKHFQTLHACFRNNELKLQSYTVYELMGLKQPPASRQQVSLRRVLRWVVLARAV